MLLFLVMKRFCYECGLRFAKDAIINYRCGLNCGESKNEQNFVKNKNKQTSKLTALFLSLSLKIRCLFLQSTMLSAVSATTHSWAQGRLWIGVCIAQCRRRSQLEREPNVFIGAARYVRARVDCARGSTRCQHQRQAFLETRRADAASAAGVGVLDISSRPAPPRSVAKLPAFRSRQLSAGARRDTETRSEVGCSYEIWMWRKKVDCTSFSSAIWLCWVCLFDLLLCSVFRTFPGVALNSPKACELLVTHCATWHELLKRKCWLIAQWRFLNRFAPWRHHKNSKEESFLLSNLFMDVCLCYAVVPVFWMIEA